MVTLTLFGKLSDQEEMVSEEIPYPRQNAGFLFTKTGGGIVGCHRLLSVGIFCFCNYPHRSAHKVPTKLQKDKCSLEKEMATHSGVLGWEIPWTEEPGGLQSMGSQKRYD